jgi:hypothetical protein
MWDWILEEAWSWSCRGGAGEGWSCARLRSLGCALECVV